MKSILLSLLSLLIYPYVFAQPLSAPALNWQKSLGGSNDDIAHAVQQTTDGGYIVAGTTASYDINVSGNHGGEDFWVVKLNSSGEIQWQKALGGGYNDEAYAVQQTSDGGFILAGNTASNEGDVSGNHGNSVDFWVVKLNGSGDLQWQKTLGGSGTDKAQSVQQTSDGGYIVAGFTDSNDGDVTGNHGYDDFWVVKLNGNGDLQWQKTLGGSNYDEATSVKQASDGGYIVVGNTASNDGDVTGHHGSDDFWIVKLNSSGAISWQKTMGGSDGDYAQSVQQTTDSGYVVAGFSQSTDGDLSGSIYSHPNFWIVKLDGQGGLQWQKSFGGSNVDDANSIQQTTDGGYIVAGNTLSNDGDVTGNHGLSDFWVIKLSDTGDLQWQKTLGGSETDGANSVQQTADGGYIVAGMSFSNNGDVSGNHGGYDYWVLKLGGTINSVPALSENQVVVYPNPFTNTINILPNIPYHLYNLNGKELDKNSLPTLPSGEYIISTKYGSIQVTKSGE